jgi:uncharacterized protein
MLQMLLENFKQRKLISPPQFVVDGCIYLVTMGSYAYGVQTEDSDYDLYGVTIPPKETVFPHLNGEILGFDLNQNRFGQWQESHIIDPDTKKEYDFSIYNIVKYFRLCADCNPNMIDSLFVPDVCIRQITKIGKLLRENKKLFLSKKIHHSFRGYSFSQMSKIGKTVKEGRKELVKKFGYDCKYAYHLVRLLNEAEQMMVEGDLDLQQSQSQLRSIRNGEWTIEEIKSYFATKQPILDKLYIESNAIPYKIQEKEIKNLLLKCLEEHYGSIDNLLKIPENITKEKDILNQIKTLVKDI